MWALFEVGRVLSSPLGSLVYHLLLLLAIEAVLGMAWEEWRRNRRGPAQRLLIGFGGLVLVRLAYVIAALVVTAGWADRTTLLPPLERFADTASLALLAWALAPVPTAVRQARIWNLILAANLALALAACTASIVLWGQEVAATAGSPGAGSGLDYNLSSQAAVWSVWQVGLALLVGLAVLRNRDEGWTESWPVSFLAVVVILAGRILQLVSAFGIASATAMPHLPAWERLANLIAYPLLVIALYQNIVVGLRLRSSRLQEISQASMDQIRSLLFLFEASGEMSRSLDLSTVLDNAAQGIARALDADQCAIAFPQDNDPGQMRLAAIYNPARHGRGEGVSFPLDYQLVVQQALRRKQYVIVKETENVQLKVLFALLGSSDVGPLLIQPLVSENQAIGAIIVGNSRSQRPFTANEAKLCQSMADQVVGAIQNARRYRSLQAKSEETARLLTEERRSSQQARAQIQDMTNHLASVQAETEEIRRREEAAREARNALEIKVVSSRAESESLTDRLATLETDLAQAHANAEAQLNWHKLELARQEATWHESLQSQESVQTILHGLTAGLIIADHNGRIVEANVASAILLDRDTEELKGADLRTVSDDPNWKQAVLTASGGDAPAVRLTTTVGANTLLCDMAPIPGTEAGKDLAEGIVVVMQDISAEIDQNQSRGAVIAQIASKAQELQSSLATAANYTNLVLSDVGIHADSSLPRDMQGSSRLGTEATAAEGQQPVLSPTGAGSGRQPSTTVGITGHKFLLRLKTSVERTSQMADDLVQLATGALGRDRSAGSLGKDAEPFAAHTGPTEIPTRGLPTEESPGSSYGASSVLPDPLQWTREGTDPEGSEAPYAAALASEASPGPLYSGASVPDPKGSGAQYAAAPATGGSPGALAERAEWADMQRRSRLWAAVDVNHLIETAVADTQPQLQDKSLVLDLELPDRLPAVDINLDDLRRAMANLLLNACLVSPMGGRIRVQASRSSGPLSGKSRSDSNGNSFVIISIRDWGGGLPHEALDLIFDRTRPGRTPQGIGASGADLALVKTLVESQRGHVWVETENGVGTTFTLALPIEERG